MTDTAQGPHHPQNVKLVQRMRAGETLDLASSPKYRWSEDTLHQIRHWLQTGGSVLGLTNLLKSNPLVIAHPVVLREIEYLYKRGDVELPASKERQQLRRGLREGRAIEFSVRKKNMIVVKHPRIPYRHHLYDPSGLRSLEADLEAIGRSWVQGLFPARRIEIKPLVSRGRSGDPVEKIYTYLTVSNLQKQLNELGTTLFIKKSTESPQQFVDRVAREVSALREEPVFIVYGVYGDRGSVRLVPPRDPLPMEDVKEAVKASLSARRRRVNKEALCLNLVSRRERKTVRAIKSIIYEVRRDFPEVGHPREALRSLFERN